MFDGMSELTWNRKVNILAPAMAMAPATARGVARLSAAMAMTVGVMLPPAMR